MCPRLLLQPTDAADEPLVASHSRTFRSWLFRGNFSVHPQSAHLDTAGTAPARLCWEHTALHFVFQLTRENTRAFKIHGMGCSSTLVCHSHPRDFISLNSSNFIPRTLRVPECCGVFLPRYLTANISIFPSFLAVGELSSLAAVLGGAAWRQGAASFGTPALPGRSVPTIKI